MSVKVASNRFIVPSFAGFYQQLISEVSSFQELGNRLVRIAERSQALRQSDTVKEAALALSNIPIKEYQLIGQYYLGWYAYRKGENPRRTFEAVAEKSKTYRAQALIMLAAVEARKHDYKSELYYFTEAMKLSDDLTTFTKTSRGIAVTKAKEGFHQQALKTLENLIPLLKYSQPHVYYDCLNSFAVELGEVGRKDEARNISRVVLASPFIHAYPEWSETAQDLREASRSFVFIDSPPAPRNVLQMPAFERDGMEYPAWAGSPGQVLDLELWKSDMAKGKKGKGNGGKRIDEMTVSDMGMRMMEIFVMLSDEKRRELITAAEKILATPTKPKPDKPKPDPDDTEGA